MTPRRFMPMGFPEEREWLRKFILWPWFYDNPRTLDDGIIVAGPPVPGSLKKLLTLPKEPEED